MDVDRSLNNPPVAGTTNFVDLTCMVSNPGDPLPSVDSTRAETLFLTGVEHCEPND